MFSSSMPKNKLPPSRPIDIVPFRKVLACRSMYTRSQFLNHAVCVTMIAAAVAPTINVSTRTSTCVSRLTIRMMRSASHGRRQMADGKSWMVVSACHLPSGPLPWGCSECLPDAEMDAPAPFLRRAVDEEAVDPIELIAEVEADGADRRLVAESRADRVPQIAGPDVPRSRPDVAGVEEEHAAEVAGEHGAELLAEREHAVAAD